MMTTWSDIDAVAVVADAADRVHLRRKSRLRWRRCRRSSCATTCRPAPGYAQKFYRLRDAGEFLVIDFVLIRRSDPLLFREVELHGRGRTWFDRRGLLVEAHLDAEADMAQARARVPLLAASFAMFQHIVTKERLRGHAVDALVFYQSMSWRPLIEALRLLHCPQRRGLRAALPHTRPAADRVRAATGAGLCARPG